MIVALLLGLAILPAAGAAADLSGILEVFDRPAALAAAAGPVGCILDTERPDVVRQKLKEKPLDQYKCRVLKRRVEGMVRLPCILVHYAEITWREFDNPNVKAVLLMARKYGLNRELDQKLFGFLRQTRVPTIGFCGGHQMIAQAFGGEIQKMRKLRPGEPDPNPKYHPGIFKEWGFMPVTITGRDPLLAGFGPSLVVKEMHAFEITRLPAEFEILAATAECRIEVIRHRERPIYGTQFHPEAYDDDHQDGKRLLLNFFQIAGVPLTSETSDGARPQPAGRPNVVLILTDDQRWDAMSCAGHPLLRTPHLDRMAAEGARFANMFVTTSLCSPSRASILSGLYAHAHGVVNNFTDYPDGLPSFPRQLKAAGYETAYVGKWHMNEDSDQARPGFDYWASHKGQAKYYGTEFNVNGRREVLEGYYTEQVTDLAVDWLRRRGQRPFLLILGHKAPHSPNVAEPKYAHLYDGAKIEYPASAFQLEGKPDWVRQRIGTWHGIYGPLWDYRKKFPDARPEGVAQFAAFVRAYLATINSIDDSAGRICDALRETGQLDRTLLIFTSDNGFFLGEHGMMDKRTMHEPSIRVPLVVRYPPLVRPGTVVDRMVLNLDIAPSILDICGAEPLPKVHGQSWKRLVSGDPAGWRTSWFYEYNYEKQFPYTPNVRGVRTDGWKYIHYPHGDGRPDRHRAELYNLQDDPLETRTLIDDPACAGRVEELRAELERLMRATGALPDRMPLDEGVKTELPAQSIR